MYTNHHEKRLEVETGLLAVEQSYLTLIEVLEAKMAMALLRTHWHSKIPLDHSTYLVTVVAMKMSERKKLANRLLKRSWRTSQAC